MSRENVVELDKEKNNLRGKAFSGVEPRLEESPSLVYEIEKPPVPEIKEGGSKKRKLLSSTISAGRKKSKFTTRSGSGEKGGVRDAEAEEEEEGVHKEKVAVVSKEVGLENVERGGNREK